MRNRVTTAERSFGSLRGLIILPTELEFIVIRLTCGRYRSALM
jgi:hypothetical protein